jgi:hypothetical protein
MYSEMNTKPNMPTTNTFSKNPLKPSDALTLTWTFSDPDAGNTQSAYHVVGTKDNWATWGYDSGNISSTSGSHTIPANTLTEGTWLFAIQYADQSGTWSDFGGSGATVFVDGTAPTYSSVDASSYVLTTTGTKRVTITNVTDNMTGIIMTAKYTKPGGTATSIAVTQSGNNFYVDVPLSANQGTWGVDFYFNDGAGNLAATYPVHTQFILDTVAPTGSISAPAKISSATSTVTLTFSASDATSGVSQMMIANDSAFTGGVWENYISTKTWTVPAGAGTKTVYFKLKDNAGNVSTTYSTNIYRNSAPTVSITTLISATGYLIDQTPKISVLTSDSDGDQITNFQIQISTVNTFATTVVDATNGGVASNGWANGTIAAGSANAFIPTAALAYGTYYIRVRINDGTEWGAWTSTVQLTIQNPSWTDTVSDTATAFKKAWIDELRTKVNAVRQARGLATKVWADGTITAASGDTAGTSIKALHITELRTAIADVLALIGATAPTWTDPTLTAASGNTPGTTRKGKHINELRTYLATC